MVSVAVLPFENRSDDMKDKYIAVSLTDDIINRLTIISGLRVTVRGQILQYEGKIIPVDGVDLIAKDLEVMNLLIGSVQRSANQVVIRAKLYNRSTSSYVWGKTFERTTENLVDVQSEIAQGIAEHLNILLNEPERARLQLKATENATAYDYYMRGRSLYYIYNAEANDSAVQQFKLAIALDTGYAIAWAGLGDSYSQRCKLAGDIVWADSCLMAASKAIQLDPNLADGYKAMANGYNYKMQYDKAFPLLQKAVELNRPLEISVRIIC